MNIDTRQKLKRNISLDAQQDPPIKKPKMRKPLETRYETPYPSSLSESQVYKLPSSIGPYLSPSKFSPIPKAHLQRNHRRTSSTNLKENASVLCSPFPKGKNPQKLKKYGKAAKRTSKKRADPRSNGTPSDSCSSSASSPDRSNQELTLAEKIHNSSISRSRASQSTTNSPAETTTRVRRPSAPTPPKKFDWKDLVPTHPVELRAPISGYPQSHFDPDANEFIRPSPNHSQIDFNRPPSQLSLYDYNRSGTYNDMDVDDVASTDQDAFFTDVQGTSTPFKNLSSLSVADRRFGGTVDPAALSGSALLLLQSNTDGQETDTDNDSCGFDSDEAIDDPGPHRSYRALKLASRNKSKSGSGYITPSCDSGDEEMGRRSPWISDSLISPPKTIDWKLVPQQAEDGAYSQVNSGDHMVTDEEDRVSEPGLQDLFDNMILNKTVTAMDAQSSPPNDTESYCVRLPLRTRSLDTAHPLSSDQEDSLNPVAPGARRTRSGTIIPGASAVPVVTSNVPPALPRRTRSGTVVPGNFGTLYPAPLNDEKQNTLGAALSVYGRRARSGTIVYSSSLAPSLPIVEEKNTTESSSAIPVMSQARRARSGSIMAASSIPEGVVANSAVGPTAAAAVPRSRIRSGSIVALGNTLGSLSSHATGFIKRPRSGTVVRASADPDPMIAVEKAIGIDNLQKSPADMNTVTVAHLQGEDVEMSLASEDRHKPLPRSPDDPIDLLEPMVFARPVQSSPPHTATLSAAFHVPSSSGLRARAKAAASKAKGLSKSLTGKSGGAKVRVLIGPEAGAAALARARARAERRSTNDDDFVNAEDLSDDELLLK
ncbi:hypothetical protein GG344DRAFT_77453 [Lentinula edodes]|nr:hypothetical protein GG344DRAFT_77453 [Lentinula edodes]